MEIDYNQQSNLTLPGILLPKQLLRPFKCTSIENLDEKMYVRIADMDTKIIKLVLAFVAFFTTVVVYLGWVLSDYTNSIALLFVILCLIAGIILSMNYLGSEPTKFVIFDREHGMVHHPRSIYSSEMVRGKWDDWNMRIALQSRTDGSSKYKLVLIYTPEKLLWTFEFGADDSRGIDSLLGYWSFIVQYMTPNELLPNVPKIKSSQEYSIGIGTWADWEEQKTKPYFVDPYMYWLYYLNLNPHLDENKAELKKLWSD